MFGCVRVYVSVHAYLHIHVHTSAGVSARCGNKRGNFLQEFFQVHDDRQRGSVGVSHPGLGFIVSSCLSFHLPHFSVLGRGVFCSLILSVCLSCSGSYPTLSSCSLPSGLPLSSFPLCPSPCGPSALLCRKKSLLQTPVCLFFLCARRGASSK